MGNQLNRLNRLNVLSLLTRTGDCRLPTEDWGLKTGEVANGLMDIGKNLSKKVTKWR